MVPDPRLGKYDPKTVKRYLVGRISHNPQKRVTITEIRRPEPDACLQLNEGAVVELTNEEIRILLHGDNGPLIHRDLLTEVPKGKDPVDSAVASAPEGKGKK